MVEHGYEQFLHHMEPDPDGAWRLHIFANDEPAMSILADMAVDRSNPSHKEQTLPSPPICYQRCGT